jgi:hypothetical protein
MENNDWVQHSKLLQNYLLNMNITLRTRPTDDKNILNYLVSIEYQMEFFVGVVRCRANDENIYNDKESYEFQKKAYTQYSKWKRVLDFIKQNQTQIIYSMIESEKRAKMY